MRVAKKLIMGVLLLSLFTTKAQNFELGEVSVKELQEEAHPGDSSAVAAILYNKGKSFFEFSQSKGFELVHEVEVRIKIYKKEGYEWGNRTVAYYIGGSDKEYVSFAKAVTYNLADGKIERTKLKNDGEFSENVNKYWAQKKIVMPNVKEGTVIEYKYTKRSPYVTNFPEWSFQQSIPVNYSALETVIPEYFSFKPVYKGFIFPVATTSTNRKMITLTTSTRSEGAAASLNNNVSNQKIEFIEAKTSYILKDLPALADERFVNNIKNYTAAVEHELSYIKYPNSPMEYFSTTWEDVVKKIYDNSDFGTELNKTGYFESDVDALVAGISDDKIKIATIFNYVQSQMNWNDFIGYNCNDGVRKAYGEKTGNVAEINLMLTSMLRYARLNANPIILSTRANGIALFPNRQAYNYVIVGVETNNGLVLLDATNKNTLPNILPIRALNWYGRMIKKDGTSSQVDLMPKGNSKDIMNVMATIGTDGNISGKLRDQYFDYNAWLFREENMGLAKDSQIDRLEKRHPGLEISEYEVINQNDLSKPIGEEMTFVHKNTVDMIGDKLYFSPMLFLASSENPFKQETRQYPIDFVFPNQDKYNISYTIPEGYEIETLPAPLNLAMSDNKASFKFNIIQQGNVIQVASVLDINSAVLLAEDYQMLKDFYKGMIEKQNEKIILKKQ